jgi:hypothetical protein
MLISNIDRTTAPLWQPTLTAILYDLMSLTLLVRGFFHMNSSYVCTTLPQICIKQIHLFWRELIGIQSEMCLSVMWEKLVPSEHASSLIIAYPYSYKTRSPLKLKYFFLNHACVLSKSKLVTFSISMHSFPCAMQILKTLSEKCAICTGFAQISHRPITLIRDVMCLQSDFSGSYND